MNKNTNSPLLSVVVPVYNVVFDLDACLESLLRQNLSESEIEIIMVDDGSTDGSNSLADKWSVRYKNFHLITQENAGLSAARNTGIKNSTGDYLIFLDSDDIVPDGAYKMMLNTLKSTGSDFITGPAYRFSKRNRLIRQFKRVADLYEESKTKLNINDHPEYIRDTTPWNKMYKRDFFIKTGIMFPEGRIYEDVATSPKLYCLAKSFDVCKDAVYYWRVSPGSITQTVNPSKSLDRLWGINRILDFFHENKTPENIKEQYDFAIIDYNLRWIYLDLWQYDKDLQVKILDIIHEITKDIDDSVINKTTKPIRFWTKLSKVNDKDKLLSILGRNKIIVNEDMPNSKKNIKTNKSLKKTIKKYRRKIVKLLQKTSKRAYRYFIYRTYRQVIWKIPIKNKSIVFSSYWGKKFSESDGPAAICLTLAYYKPDFKCIVFASKKEFQEIKNNIRALNSKKIVVIKNNSLRYFYYLWTSKYLFNDVNFIVGYKNKYYTEKRPEQVEVQTTHGVPLKKMGIDSDEAIKKKDIDIFLKKSKRYDYLVSTSNSVAKQFSESHGVKPKILRTGLPQNDFIFNKIDDNEKKAIKNKYGIDTGKKIAVYAPTFRYGKGYAFRYLMDFNRIKDVLGDEYQIIIKTHPFNHTNINLIDFENLTEFSRKDGYKHETFIKIFGEARYKEDFKEIILQKPTQKTEKKIWNTPADINELMLIADVLITDYSSTMFNFIHLDKPMIFFTPDIKKYNSTRGLYYNIDKIAPGYIAKNTEDLIKGLRLSEKKAEWSKEYHSKIEWFKCEFTAWEKGNASVKILKELGIIDEE